MNGSGRTSDANIIPKGSCVPPARINCRGDRCDILCLGESPWHDEARLGEAFIGESGQVLRSVLGIEFPDRPVILDNVVPEYLFDRRPKKEDRERWKSYVDKAIKRYKPRVIWLLGEHAIRSCCAEYHKPEADCGLVVNEDGKPPMVISVHPAYVLRLPARITMLKTAALSVKRVLSGAGISGHRHVESSPLSFCGFLEEHAGDLCAVDIETSNLDPEIGTVLTVAVATKCGTCWTPLFHPENHEGVLQVFRELKKWWPGGPRVVHNAMMELNWFRQWGCPDPPELYDTLIEAFFVDENQPKGLDQLAVRYLDAPPWWTEIPTDGTSFAQVPLRLLGPYNWNDARYTLQLHHRLRKMMTEQQCKLMDKVFMPTIGVLLEMQRNGVKIDGGMTQRLRRQRERDITALLGMASYNFRAEAPEINWGSPHQVRKLVFETLKLKPEGITKKGAFSVDKDAMEGLVKQEPRLEPLKVAGQLRRLINGPLTELLVKRDEKGFVHTHFGLGHVVTGRLSSSDPNLQNIDRPDEKIKWKGCQRLAMISRFKGGKIVQLDYKQHELRCIMATVGQMQFLKAFQEGLDPHQMVADRLKCERSKAKNCNFGVIYGATASVLEETYGIEFMEAANLIAQWFKDCPEVKRHHMELVEECTRHGYVENVFGYRRHLGRTLDTHARKQAYNAGNQNMAVVICYMAMVEINRWLKEKKMRTVLILQLHDSIVADCPGSEVKRFVRAAKDIMIDQSYRMREFLGTHHCNHVPLDVDVKIKETL